MNARLGSSPRPSLHVSCPVQVGTKRVSFSTSAGAHSIPIPTPNFTSRESLGEMARREGERERSIASKFVTREKGNVWKGASERASRV